MLYTQVYRNILNLKIKICPRVNSKLEFYTKNTFKRFLWMQKHFFIFRKSLFFFSFLILVLLCSCIQTEPKPTERLPIEYLINYVAEKGSDYTYEISDSIVKQDYTLYHIKMISGSWLTEDEVRQTLWWHWVDIVVPKEITSPNALLYVGGGSSNDNKIYLDSIAIIQSIKTKSVIAHISNVPFQRLNFKGTDSIDRYEDNIIAYGWEKFLSKGAKNDDMIWLARFPMTRAVVRAMDVIEEITKHKAFVTKKFVVSGASKRGWTTWTSAAVDDRVVGIVPLVIDLLNVLPSFEHHYKAYGDWSPAVQNYVEVGIMDWMGTPAFDRLMDLVEPYEFKEIFKLPKLIVNGTIDEFFLPDSWQFYWDQLPDPKYLQYVPNGNHGLAGSYRAQNVYSFYDRLIHKKTMPNMDWKILGDSIFVDIDTNEPYNISLWKANNPKARDFRIWEIGKSWEKSIIPIQNSGTYALKIPEGEGYTASLIEVIFRGNQDSPITLTTGTVVRPDTYKYEPYEPKLIKKLD